MQANTIDTKMTKSKRGFTLVELVVVIALLAVLAGIAIPVVGYTMNRSKASAAASDAKLVEESLKESHAQIVSGLQGSYNYTTKVGDVMSNAGVTDVSTSIDIAGTTYQLMWNDTDEQCRYVNTAGSVDIQGNPIAPSHWTRNVAPNDNVTTVVSFFK